MPDVLRTLCFSNKEIIYFILPTGRQTFMYIQLVTSILLPDDVLLVLCCLKSCQSFHKTQHVHTTHNTHIFSYCHKWATIFLRDNDNATIVEKLATAQQATIFLLRDIVALSRKLSQAPSSANKIVTGSIPVLVSIPVRLTAFILFLVILTALI